MKLYKKGVDKKSKTGAVIVVVVVVVALKIVQCTAFVCLFLCDFVFLWGVCHCP